METPEFIKLLMKFNNFINNLTNFTKELLDQLHGKNIDNEYQRVLYKFIERFHLNFVTIKNSWKDYLNQPKFRTPFYILLRTLISDYIILVYLIEALKFEKGTHKPIEKEFFKRYSEISKDYFSRLDGELQKLIRNNKLSQKRRIKFLLMEKDSYPEFFEEGKRIQVKKGVNMSPGAIITKLQKGNFKRITGIYQYYFYFSQYEHFTIKAEELSESDKIEEFKIFIETVDYLIRGQLMVIGIMKMEDGLLLRLNDLISEFEKKFIT